MFYISTYIRSSYRKLAWVGFETTTTEFRSDALIDWAIRPWVQLALTTNFVQLLQIYVFVQCSHFISAIAFVSRSSNHCDIIVYTYTNKKYTHILMSINCSKWQQLCHQVFKVWDWLTMTIKENMNIKYFYFSQPQNINFNQFPIGEIRPLDKSNNLFLFPWHGLWFNLLFSAEERYQPHSEVSLAITFQVYAAW